MSSPLDFLLLFADRLRGAGIRFAITSGMACVHYGLAQNTKDSDWIIRPEDLAKLRELFTALEREGWRVSYRSIFGAPLEEMYLGNGWTSHFVVTEPDGSEQKVDVFGKPPRVPEWVPEPSGFATRHVVALMKRTDREKDWPFVNGFGAQLAEASDAFAVLHLQEPEWLLEAWRAVPQDRRGFFIAQRPLLGLLDREPSRAKRLLLVERFLWQTVNAQRGRVYQHCWKEFFRSARGDAVQAALTAPDFSRQHAHLFELCRNHRLELDPLEHAGRDHLVAKAKEDVAELLQASASELDAVTPPVRLLLP